MRVFVFLFKFLFFRNKSKIAVMEIHGVIGDKLNINAYCELLRKVNQSPKYKALLLDIKSPGGSAAGTEVLFHEIKKVADSKPVVAYIREVGASGGYYLACGARHITALPTTVVGSIGVIFVKPVAEQLLSKIGIQYSVFTQGKYKDMGGFWRESTEEENEKFNSLLKEVYDNFVGVVSESRSVYGDELDNVTTGEIFTGNTAKELNLIDELGGFDETLDKAVELSGSKRRTIKLKPKKSFADKLAIRAQSNNTQSGILSVFDSLLTGGIYYLDSTFALKKDM